MIQIVGDFFLENSWRKEAYVHYMMECACADANISALLDLVF